MAESCNKELWMQEALEIARQGLSGGEVPVGCVLVRNEAILVSAHNEVSQTKDPTRHAELVALDLLRDKLDTTESAYRDFLSTCTLYVTLEPCIMCTAALRMMGVCKVVYGYGNTRFGGCGSVMDTHSKQFQACYSTAGQRTSQDLTIQSELQVINGVLGSEALQLLQQFYAQVNPNAPNPAKRTKIALDMHTAQ